MRFFFIFILILIIIVFSSTFRIHSNQIGYSINKVNHKINKYTTGTHLILPILHQIIIISLLKTAGELTLPLNIKGTNNKENYQISFMFSWKVIDSDKFMQAVLQSSNKQIKQDIIIQIRDHIKSKLPQEDSNSLAVIKNLSIDSFELNNLGVKVSDIAIIAISPLSQNN